MIESKTLGSAVGIQYQGVIDKSEGTDLPSLANGVIVGKFKRGRMDKPFKVTAKNYQALLGRDPSNPNYLAVEDAFKRGVSEISILRTGGAGASGCKIIPSAWSNPITFAMVNKPTGNGGIQVNFGVSGFANSNSMSGTWVNLADKSTIEEFFADFNESLSWDAYYELEVKSNDDGSVLIRVVPNKKNGGASISPDAKNVVYAMGKAANFYIYDSSNIGNNAEAQLYLANAFTDDAVIFSSCEYKPDDGFIPT